MNGDIFFTDLDVGIRYFCIDESIIFIQGFNFNGIIFNLGLIQVSR